MISFIIIGKNIANTIAICLSSVDKFIEENTIVSSELIYVDSNSVDDSVKIASQFAVKIIQLEGKVNAAVGRNVGVNHSKGDVLFFIDGDMEILPDFYEHVFNGVGKLSYPFSNGFWIDRLYDGNFNFLYSEDINLPEKPFFSSTTGGLMIIQRELWESVGGMDERLTRSQDHDLGFRLEKKGFPSKRYNKLFAIHHTVSYFERNRLGNFLFSKALFSQGILMRKHLTNISYLRRYRNNVLYVGFLFFSLLILFFVSKISIVMICLYIILQFTRAFRQRKEEKEIFHSFLYKILFSIYTLFSFLFYFPRKKRKYIVKEFTQDINDLLI
jgi:glycosyltransferase involved in cell wall biosynthesis